MSILGAAILVLAAMSGDSSAPLDSPSTTATERATAAINNEPVFPPRKPAEMRTAVSNALRATATTKNPAARDLAIRQLILVLLELEQDQNLMHDERVELHTQVRSRLISLAETLQAEAKRDRKPNADQAKQQKKPQTIPSVAPQNVGSVQQAAQSKAADNKANIQQQSSDNLQVLGQLVGGGAGVNVQRGPVPGAFAGAIPGGAAANGNAGAQLRPTMGQTWSA